VLAPRGHASNGRSGRKAGERPASPRAGAEPDATRKLDPRDKAIEVIHDLRPADPPRPGEHSNQGSPIESDVGLDRKRKDPSAP
jgi:hypothetical protein